MQALGLQTGQLRAQQGWGATALHEKPEHEQCDFQGPEPGQMQNCTGMNYLQVLPPDANSSGAEGMAQSWAPGAAPGNPR